MKRGVGQSLLAGVYGKRFAVITGHSRQASPRTSALPHTWYLHTGCYVLLTNMRVGHEHAAHLDGAMTRHALARRATCCMHAKEVALLFVKRVFSVRRRPLLLPQLLLLLLLLCYCRRLDPISYERRSTIC